MACDIYCEHELPQCPDEPSCEGLVRRLGRLVLCGATEDIVDGRCVACAAADREREEAAPLAVEDAPTARTVHTVKCPQCHEVMPTLALIEGGHTCREAA